MSTVSPNDIVVERAVLGAALIDPSVLPDLQELLTAADFYSDSHAAIWKAITQLAADEKEIDTLALTGELQRVGALERAGGHDYLLALTNTIPVNAVQHAETVAQLAERRRLQSGTLQIAARCHDSDPAVTRAALEALLTNAGPAQPGDACTLAEAAAGAIDATFQRGDNQRLTTGMTCLDRSVGGYEPGNLVIVAADTGVGKSSLALRKALGMAEYFPVGIVSCEDNRGVWGSRAAGYWSGVSPMRMRTEPTDDDYARLGKTADALPNLPIHLEIQIGKSEDHVIAAMRRLVRRHGARVLFIDYVQCILSAHPNAPRRDQIARMAARFKGVAASLGVPLILLSQLSRPTAADTGREPSIHHLKESGDLENAADLILLLWVPDEARPNEISMKIGKAKWGARLRNFKLLRVESGGLEEQSLRVVPPIDRWSPHADAE